MDDDIEEKGQNMVTLVARDIPMTVEALTELVGQEQPKNLIDQIESAIYANIADDGFNQFIKTTSNEDAVEGHKLADMMALSGKVRGWANKQELYPLATTDLWTIKTKLTPALKRCKLDIKSRMERAYQAASAASQAAE